MIKIILKSFYAFLVIFYFTNNAYAQCEISDIDALGNECASKLKNYKYMETTEFRKDLFTYGGEKIEQKKFFSKGNTYMIVLGDKGKDDNKLCVEIYDSHKKLMASSYNEQTKKFFSKIYFVCKSSESYYFKYYFHNNVPTCGVSVIGFTQPIKTPKK